MSYFDPIDTKIVQAVVDDLEDCNAHTICDLLRAHYGLPGAVPEDVFDSSYDAAKEVLFQYRMERSIKEIERMKGAH
jgi:hypothetical protein